MSISISFKVTPRMVKDLASINARFADKIGSTIREYITDTKNLSDAEQRYLNEIVEFENEYVPMEYENIMFSLNDNGLGQYVTRAWENWVFAGTPFRLQHLKSYKVSYELDTDDFVALNMVEE
ncbi:hypothetical protein HDR60_03130 [bacterium]|nr:hypothetical protein [bacterium]